MRRRRSAFTAVELAIVISISAVLVPAIYVLGRNVQSGFLESLATVRAADAARALSEELRHDRATMRWDDVATVALALAGDGACSRIVYRLDGRTLVREGAAGDCGAPRAIAKDVVSVQRTAWGVELVLDASGLRPDARHVTMRIAIGGDT